jgi:hypothetical protein
MMTSFWCGVRLHTPSEGWLEAKLAAAIAVQDLAVTVVLMTTRTSFYSLFAIAGVALMTALSGTSASAAEPPVSQPVDRCGEYTELGSGYGGMVSGKYTTASLCLTGGVDAARTFAANARTIDTKNDTLCTYGKFQITSNGRVSTMNTPLNCTGTTTSSSSYPIKVSNVSKASMAVCVTTKTAGSSKPLSCSSWNVLYPAATGTSTGKR